jgi:phage gp46-like protein
MAQDVKLQKNDDGIYDIPLNSDGTDLDTIDGLETAITVSLFTFARANPGNVLDAFKRRGWVGNLLSLSEGYELGSELWVLEQARIDTGTMNKIKNFVQRALNWMITDGIADRIEVSAFQLGERGARVDIILRKNATEVGRYSTVWNNTQPLG